MSQSDYLSKKKIVLQLQKQTEFPHVLNSSLYTLSRAHSISSNITNSLITRNQLTTTDASNNCSNFLVCTNTNSRPNRILHEQTMYSDTRRFVKNQKNKKCDKFCYDSSYNLLHTNNTNRLYSSYNNKRLRDLCQCISTNVL